MVKYNYSFSTELHKRLKMFAAEHNMTMQDAMTLAIEGLVKSDKRTGKTVNEDAGSHADVRDRTKKE